MQNFFGMQDIIVTGDEDITMPNPAEKFEELLTRFVCNNAN